MHPFKYFILSPILCLCVSWATTPQDVLKDGQDSRRFINPENGKSVTIRKATIKTLIDNTLRFNTLVMQPTNSENKKEIEEIIMVLTSIVEALCAGGTFELFEPSEWLQDPHNQGRILMGCLYLRAYPHHLTDDLTTTLKNLMTRVNPVVQSQINLCLNKTPLAIEEAKQMSHFTQYAKTPEKLLAAGKDGLEIIDPFNGKPIFVRKGTIAAIRLNVKEMNKLLRVPLTSTTEQHLNQLIKESRDLVTSVRVLGLFNLFPAKEWLTNDKQPGRILIGLFLLQQHPSLVNNSLKERVAFLKESGHSIVQNEIAILERSMNEGQPSS